MSGAAQHCSILLYSRLGIFRRVATYDILVFQTSMFLWLPCHLVRHTNNISYLCCIVTVGRRHCVYILEYWYYQFLVAVWDISWVHSKVFSLGWWRHLSLEKIIANIMFEWTTLIILFLHRYVNGVAWGLAVVILGKTVDAWSPAKFLYHSCELGLSKFLTWNYSRHFGVLLVLVFLISLPHLSVHQQYACWGSHCNGAYEPSGEHSGTNCFFIMDDFNPLRRSAKQRLFGGLVGPEAELDFSD